MPGHDTVKKLATNVLLVFILITIGFSLGKHSILSKVSTNPAVAMPDNSSLPVGKKIVKVFYMHTTFRCITCNNVEALARELVDNEFSEAKEKQTLLWEDVNFQENEVLARRFDVVTSCIVLATMEGGEVNSFVRLDEAWNLIDKPEEFNSYLKTALAKALSEVVKE